MRSAAAILGADGPFARQLEFFAPRLEQQQFAEAVQHALENRDTLIAEAGTGVGKTFAYLVPTLMSGARVIISTGTRHLQDQLFRRDLPLVRRALSRDVRVALLKGRANYLCLRRLRTAGEVPALWRRDLQVQLQQVNAWAGRTLTGELSEVAGVPEDSLLWPQVTSTAENCLGLECPDFADCFVVKARKQAQQVDLLVVNHHLFCADLALKEEGFGELLPNADAFIFDEAHQLPEVASNFFGTRLTSRQLGDLLRDSVTEQRLDAPDMADIESAAQQTDKASRDFRLTLGTGQGRMPWLPLLEQAAVRAALEALEVALGELAAQLAVAAPRGKGLDSCHRRCLALETGLERFQHHQDDGSVQWLETSRTGYALHLTPVSVGETFKGLMPESPTACVFTSATLSVSGSFAHFRACLGLEEAGELALDSPFDYRRNALLYVPRGLPEPGHRDYTTRVLEVALPVLQLSRGRAFFLFTSHRALQEAAGWLATRISYPVLVQGTAPKGELTRQFEASGKAVLLGASSFWEGVDVRGEALSCVIIDKLPFASPGDPVLQARLEAIAKQGGNPFYEYQVPQAVISLKQGVGRLIRDVSDRGIFMLCDPRLLTRGYGRSFIKSLPDVPMTQDLEDVERFFSESDLG